MRGDGLAMRCTTGYGLRSACRRKENDRRDQDHLDGRSAVRYPGLPVLLSSQPAHLTQYTIAEDWLSFREAVPGERVTRDGFVWTERNGMRSILSRKRGNSQEGSQTTQVERDYLDAFLEPEALDRLFADRDR
jgi:hypothetical protein